MHKRKNYAVLLQVARIMRDTFKDRLYIRPPNANFNEAPSPAALKGKILIKAKMLPGEKRKIA